MDTSMTQNEVTTNVPMLTKPGNVSLAEAIDTIMKLKMGNVKSQSFWYSEDFGSTFDLSTSKDTASPFLDGIPESSLEAALFSQDGTQVVQLVNIDYASFEDHKNEKWANIIVLGAHGQDIQIGYPPGQPLRGPYFLKIWGASYDEKGDGTKNEDFKWRLEGWEYDRGWSITIGFTNSKAEGHRGIQKKVMLWIMKK